MSHFINQRMNGVVDYEWSRLLGRVENANFDFKALADALDCQKNFYGVGIIYNDGSLSYLVRSPKKTSTSERSQVTHVIVTKVILATRDSAAKSVKEAVSAPSLWSEGFATGLSCGALILTVAAAGLAAGTVPLTGGISTPLALLTAAGTTATALQCFNGIWRLWDISSNDAKTVNWVDSQDWYIATTTALDIISLSAAAGAMKEIVATYRFMKSSSSIKVREWLMNFSRSERVRLTENIIKRLNPGVSKKVIKAMIKAGKYPRRYPSEAFHKTLQQQLVNTITSAMAFSGSATSGVIRYPSSIPKSGEYVYGLLQSIDVVN